MSFICVILGQVHITHLSHFFSYAADSRPTVVRQKQGFIWSTIRRAATPSIKNQKQGKQMFWQQGMRMKKGQKGMLHKRIFSIFTVTTLFTAALRTGL